jgi:cellulose synthase/poly-beta-1,6-N-acetylglucosamine synthase-like glycosyltransferase
VKLALISTVYNESASVARWVDALSAQTVQSDEFVIVDGGSTDGTVDLLKRGFETTGFTRPRIIVQRCNIAEGRNLAIRNTSSEVIISLDAGSVPEKEWLAEIVKPLRENQDVGVVGGWCPCIAGNAFQKRLEKYSVMPGENMPVGSDCRPSSRNVAFRRKAWESVGGYPEWLTLTAEDALFNANLHSAGIRFFYQPSAVVRWEARPDLAGYLKMMWSYGYGSGEMGQDTHLYWRWLLTTLVPPLILLSRNPVSDMPLRYLRNAATVLGWINGRMRGHKPPRDWKRLNGVWLGPQTIATMNANRAGR